MKWEVRRTKINRYDQGDVPPKFKAEVELTPSDLAEVITVGDLDALLARAMADFGIPADAGLVGTLALTFRWE